MASGVTGSLARFALTPLDTSADAARAMLRLSLLDWAAVAIAGAGEPVAGIVRAAALEEGGRAEATVIGTGVRLPARAAALVNGTTSHALDYDDTHFAHIGHPSVAVIPAALAMAERVGAGGAAFLEAALVGVEASIRVGVWLGRSHYQAGFHQTATAGSFGAVLAAARLAGLDRERIVHALGLAATRASGLKAQFGTMGKPFNAGIAAANGVEAVLLAARGMTSRPEALDGPQGLAATHHGEANDAAFAGLGEEWLTLGISHKFHACCHGTHAALEALREARAQGAGDAVEAVEIVIHPRWLNVCNIAAPETGLEAKFSYRLTAAMALAGRSTAALESFSDSACADPALVALRERVRVTAEEAVPETAARVRLRFASGEVREAFHDLSEPRTPAELRPRIAGKVLALLGAERAARLVAAVPEGGAADLPALAACLAEA
ncbi:2-methylcitrate dehydratase PrpD [Meinhardsimonia xiamenensis]|jgi:2-methylcitrate dehydratase PrpD|uniref:2-methylcitrate dehydratase PrpD n=1 Tax=Meinhardsimonia xiamenensis TaxID=990712 RepID=A0A1G9FEU7_9RHOB|nr:MmgE/PrpD family protein [Meinhardsimonia xiamenensis]PRX37878.1 2-methylcitrate dehydratase PrpD [Meinhardsimonia xiamenensis]SDK86862.1 2-methylcitrate dehydratase PrpD [Meinhardsimonia xiamenensis]